MRFFVKLLLVLAVLGGIGAAAVTPLQKYWKERNRPSFRTAAVTSGRIVSVRNSTGTIKPVLSVQVGSFVSGPIVELNVDFNDEVKEGDVLAKIDPRIYEAVVARDRAVLATRKADLERAVALLTQAENNEERALALRGDGRDFISDSELDQYKFNRSSLKAQCKVAEATIESAEANLKNSLLNLEYTEITSPVDGIIIDRKIDPGQTLASQFQTPELFVVAPDMRKEMHVFASVDETDIGLIRAAKERGEPVEFTVDAYQEDLFVGTIWQIRMSSTTTQNVVTYPVLISAPNPELKLLPGMTAKISFQIEAKDDVLKIPNAALRFFPKREIVREQDRKLLDGSHFDSDDENKDDNLSDSMISASDKVEAGRKSHRRHVWVVDGDFLKAIEVTTGISDSKFTELVSGELTDEQKLVTGIKAEK